MELEMLQVSQDSDGIRYHFTASFSEGIHLLSGSDASAKTLLLSLLTGKNAPDHGEIRFLGYDIMALGRAYQNHLAYFSRFPLFPDSFTLSHYLIYTGILQRLEPDQARGKAFSLIRRFGLENFAGQTLGELPSAIKKRVLLANTLHSEAPVLLLDKPFTYASADDLDWMFPHLLKLRERKIILMSVEREHLMDKIPHRTLYLENGTILPEACLREKTPV